MLLVTALLACQAAPVPSDAAPGDGGSDAAPAPDAACAATAGELPGERRVAAGALLPDLTFTTADGSASLTDFHVPCAPRAELIVVREIALWSGHSRWHLGHTSRLLSHPERARLHFVDLVLEDEDALPAHARSLAAASPLYDVMPDVVGLDPDETFASLTSAGARLPAIAIIDARSLRLLRLLFGARAGQLEQTIDVVLSMLDASPAPGPYSPTLVDGRFSEDEWDLIEGMAYPATPPPDLSNARADDPAAAALGAALFADTGLSPAGVACATCHDPAQGFGDARALGHGVADVTRHTPTLYASAFVRWPFWDGRVDSLWAQALGPVENAREMGSSRLVVAHRVAGTHRASFEAVFGAMPDLSDATRFPAAGAPGDPAWESMSAADQALVTRVFTDVGKAIEAYERTLAPPRTRFDDYVAGDTSALTELERDGLHEFVLEGCADCHHGPAMSDSAFHAIAMPGAGTGATLDTGRAAALATLSASPFRRQGAFSDDPGAPDPLAGVGAFDPSTLGAFRTPTLRALSRTAPYGHAGTFARLRDVVDHYARIRMLAPDPRVAGGIDAHVVGFDAIAERIDPLTAFLETL